MCVTSMRHPFIIISISCTESPPTHTSHPVVGAIDIVADTREGFWKHAVITIRWKRPTKGHLV